MSEINGAETFPMKNNTLPVLTGLCGNLSLQEVANTVELKRLNRLRWLVSEDGRREAALFPAGPAMSPRSLRLSSSSSFIRG